MTNLKTIAEVYLVKPLKIGGKVIEVEGVELDMMERQGNEYVNFFNLCKVEVAPVNSIVEVGNEVLVHHGVLDQVDITEEDRLLCYIEQIKAVKVGENHGKDSDEYIRNFKSVKGGFLTEPISKQNFFSESINNQEFYEENASMTFDGKIVEYIDSADYEIFYNEKLYFHVKEEDCYLIDEKVTSNFIEVEIKDNRIMNGKDILLALHSDLQTSLTGRRFIRKDMIGGIINISEG